MSKTPRTTINPVAKSLRLGMNQPKIVKPKKGKGSYSRKAANEAKE